MSALSPKWLYLLPVAASALAAAAYATADSTRGAPSPASFRPIPGRWLALSASRPTATQLVLVGDLGRVALSFDDGAHWQWGASPTDAALTAVTFVDPNRGWAVGHRATILHTQDGGRTWQHQQPDRRHNDPLFAVHFFDAARGLAAGAYGARWITSDGGRQWSRLPDVPIDADGDRHWNAILPLGNGQVQLLGERGARAQSADYGRTWQPLPALGRSIFGVVPTRSGGIAFGLRGTVFRSIDSGRSWQAVATGLDTHLQAGLQHSAGDITRLWLAGSNGSLLESVDGGQSFRQLPTASRLTIATLIPAGSGLLLATEAGLQRAPR